MEKTRQSYLSPKIRYLSQFHSVVLEYGVLSCSFLLTDTFLYLSISIYLIYSILFYSHLISSHLISSHLISSHLISSHLISSHLISSHLISSHLISSIYLSIYLSVVYIYIYHTNAKQCVSVNNQLNPPTLLGIKPSNRKPPITSVILSIQMSIYFKDFPAGPVWLSKGVYIYIYIYIHKTHHIYIYYII